MFPVKIKKILEKKNKKKIICLSSYSKNIAQILDKYCDIVLVGDSLGSVLYNYNTTRNVSLNTMIEHSKSVKKGIKKSLMVVDMSYKTYRNPREALKNAKYILFSFHIPFISPSYCYFVKSRDLQYRIVYLHLNI